MDVATIATIVGVLIAWVTYKKTFPKTPKEENQRFQEQEALQAHFRTTQRIAKEVREGLTEYATRNNLLDADMYPGITYRVAIKTMDESHAKCLSDELYDSLVLETYTRPQIKLLHEDLNTQYKALSEMKNQILLYKNV
jgi:hypothetical protein